VFDDIDQVQRVSDLILGHYNGVIRQLDRRRYSPIFEFDTRNDPCPCGSGKKFKKCCLN